MQSLTPIRVFLEVAAKSSFAGAARSLRMTPPSVTRIIAQLESDLGQQLLLRTTRQVSLTSAGALVAARYKPVLADFDRISEDLHRNSRPDQGKLRINAPVSMGLRLLPDVLHAFRTQFPGIQVDLRMTDSLVDVIAENCDLAIRISGPPTDKSTIWRKICAIPRSIVAHPSILNDHTSIKRPEDIPPEKCMSYSDNGEAEAWVLHGSHAKRTIRAGTNVISNNGDFLCGLAAKGQGFVMLPDFITAPEVKSASLVRVLEEWFPTPLWLTLYYPPYTQLPPLVATFTDFFDAYMRNLDGLDFDPAR